MAGFADGLMGIPPEPGYFLARCYSVSITPAAVLTITAPEQTFTVTGVDIFDQVNVSAPGVTAGVAMCSARVTAANTVGIQWCNPTAGSLTPPAGVYKFIAIKTA